jgi:hypothetical protein
MPGTYEYIAKTTLSSAQSTITLSSIPSTYTDLVLIIRGGLTSAGSVQIQYNGDTGSNYSNTAMWGYGSGQGSSRNLNATKGELGGSWSSTTVFVHNIQNYSNTTTYKTSLGRYSDATDTVGASVVLWRSTAAINQIVLTNNGTTYVSGTNVTLYGIKAA